MLSLTLKYCTWRISCSMHTFLIFIFVLVFVMPLETCPLWGQAVQKKALTSDDYHLWGALHFEKISPNQQWVCYTMSYQQNIDTLFIRNIKTRKTYYYTSAQNSIFTKNNSFVCLTGQGLHITNLKTGKQQLIKSVSRFEYAPHNDLLVALRTSADKGRNLIIKTPEGRLQKEIAGVTDFSISPDKQFLVYGTFKSNKYAVMLLNWSKTAQEKCLLTSSTHQSYGFTWHKEGKAVAFAAKNSNRDKTKLFYYFVQNDKLFELDPSIQPYLPVNTYIPSDFSFKVIVSDDMKKVFFSTKTIPFVKESKELSDVEIWNANDKSIYHKKKLQTDTANSVRTAVWLPFSNFSKALTNSKLPGIMLSGDQQYAFLYNRREYEPQFDLQQGPSDIYAVNLKTFDKKLLLQKQSAHNYDFMPSPSGRYICYYKNEHFWVYNITAATHHNITAAIPAKFTNSEKSYTIAAGHSIAGWSTDEKEILLYDQFDIWAVKLDGSGYRRLTKGRELKIKYRLARTPQRPLYVSNYEELILEYINLEKSLFLHGQGDDGKTGYFKWDKTSGEKPIIYKDAHIDQLNYTEVKQNLFYREQSFAISPRIMLKNKENTPIAVFQSNPHQEKYFWSTSEVIKYKNSKGINLEGILRYPADYDPLKKYPMIVIIYEKQNYKLHKYNFPSSYTEDAESDIVWTTQGYFVLRPDIITQYEDPGISALDCVTAAVNEALEKGIIDHRKIGLMGHSFGGYETAFISTQSNLFATAVAGAASTDLYSFYYTLAGAFSFPNMYRYTDGQWKIRKTPLENPQIFLRNSPIAFADKVRIPILLWHGQKDPNIDAHQSMEFYFALRRMGKKSIMLLYPDEGHSIMKSVNQKDMIERVQQWFAYFLKGDSSAEWITLGTK